ncbi:MAG TPA: DUF4166 domain-containing protein [Gallionellaceae bacterium]|nr:DUF4166 domain-containing protein [Gallionellaceae bacterium]
MDSLMQNALGADWDKLPPALQTHYRFGKTTDNGYMDIEYPRFMQPYLSVLHLMGALIDRGGRQVPTVVEKTVVGERQYWRRTITFPDGKVVYFNSFWVFAGGNQMIEFVNPVLGLQMAVHVEDGKLHYEGVRFVAKLGSWLVPIPEWMVLGHTTITEHAIDATHFAMDFRLTHPLFGKLFRYSGTFEATAA